MTMRMDRKSYFSSHELLMSVKGLVHSLNVWLSINITGKHKDTKQKIECKIQAIALSPCSVAQVTELICTSHKSTVPALYVKHGGYFVDHAMMHNSCRVLLERVRLLFSVQRLEIPVFRLTIFFLNRNGNHIEVIRAVQESTLLSVWLAQSTQIMTFGSGVYFLLCHLPSNLVGHLRWVWKNYTCMHVNMLSSHQVHKTWPQARRMRSRCCLQFTEYT